MMLAWNYLTEPLVFHENEAVVLVIENRPALRAAVESLRRQLEGENGDFVLSEKYELLEFSRAAFFLSDPFSPELDTKRLATKIGQAAAEAAENYAAELRELAAQVNELAFRISSELDFDASFTELDQGFELLKLMSFRVDQEELCFADRLLTMMKLNRNFFGKRLFIFYNLRQCLTEEELLSFYQAVFYEKYSVLLIESVQGMPRLSCEKQIILDEDLCIL